MKVPTLAATDIDAGAPRAIEAFGVISANTREALSPLSRCTPWWCDFRSGS